MLEELRGSSLEDVVDAIPVTLDIVKGLYDSNQKHMKKFYEGLRENPPTTISKGLANLMPARNDLLISPDEISYTVAYNVGEYAGQSFPHLHAQVFPCRKRRAGVVGIMKKVLN